MNCFACGRPCDLLGERKEMKLFAATEFAIRFRRSVGSLDGSQRYNDYGIRYSNNRRTYDNRVLQRKGRQQKRVKTIVFFKKRITETLSR